MSKATQKQTTLLGRNTESKKLQEIYQDVITNKRSRVVLIEGALGIGKTALVEYFIQTVTDPKSGQKNPLVGIGKCTFESQMVGLQPFGQMLSNLGNNKSFEITMGNALKFVAEVAPAWADIFTQGAASKTVKALSTSFTSGNDSFMQERKLDINLAYTGFAKILQKIAKKQPVIGFIDDFHWADKSSIGLLNYLVDPENLDGFNESQVMLIVSYRPFETKETRQIISESKSLRETREIKISDGIPAREYVNSFYPNHDLPKHFLDEVEKHTEGNPLLLKQLFSYLESNNDINKQEMNDGSHSWKASQRLSSPDFIQQILQKNVVDSVKEVLLARYRLLQDKDLELYETLSFASVEGEYFSAQVIAALRGKNLEDVFRSLQKLENVHQMVQHAENKIIDINGKALDTYHFNPLILQDTIYSSLSSGQQRTRHKQVAEFLEDYSGFEKTIFQLAIQFQKAKEPLKAAQYALRAAQYEQSQSKIAEAEKWCGFGLELLNDLTSLEDIQKLRLELRKAIADGYFYSGKYKDAVEKYSDLLEPKDLEVATAEAVAEIFAQAAHACILKGDSNQQANDYCVRGKNYLKNIPFNQYYFALEVIYIKARDVEKEIKIELFKALIEYGETLKDESYRNKHLALAHKWQGSEHQDRGEYKEAENCYHESNVFAKKCTNKDLEAQAILNLADLNGEFGKFELGLRYTGEGYSLSREINEIDNMAYSLAIEGNIYLQQESYEKALGKLQQAIDDSEKAGSDWNMPFMCADIAVCLLKLEKNKEALEFAQKAVEYKEDNVKYGYALCALGRVTALMQDNKDHIKYFAEALEKLDEAGHRNFLSQAKYYLAEILLQTKNDTDRNKALILLQDAYAEFEKLGIKHRMDLAKDLMSKQRLDLIA
ncbi:MAG: AAA family ATPase [Chloroflexota bacterium]